MGDKKEEEKDAAKSDDESEDEEEDEEGSPLLGKLTKKGKKKKKKAKGIKKRGDDWRKELSAKEEDFQIRIRIVEARQIQGANINPVCRVQCWNQTRQSKIHKSTNSPHFNEIFFFNFKVSPQQLMDEIVEFRIYNSRRLRSDALIGSFKCDIGMIYEQEHHAFLNRWLLLSDPDDPSALAKGYVKFCAMVMGTGDEPPEVPVVDDDDDDIEGNLLRPAGITLRPGNFTIKAYRAEDIPRMDPDMVGDVQAVFGMEGDKKELVDPYVIFSFAGREVQTKIMQSNENPEFNQELTLGTMLPSMCERLKITIMDWDRMSGDDVVATAFIPMSLISAPGDAGFLPTFGPCFVNFYGSKREYSSLTTNVSDMDIGKGEGVAYRGRALMEMNCNFGEAPELDVVDMPNEDVVSAMRFQRRRKYKLHAAFLESTMVCQNSEGIQFELSIGNYGNVLDPNVPPSSSTTQPTMPVFDGHHYYYLPFGASKPCVSVESQWEDISFRLDRLNRLLLTVDRMKENMKDVYLSMRGEEEVIEQAGKIIKTLNDLMEDLSQTLPEPHPTDHAVNDLDRKLTKVRYAQIFQIREEAFTLRENATDMSEAVDKLEEFLALLEKLAVEPQNSMPDVLIWMLVGEKRVAYFRIPAYDVLFSPEPNCSGRFCGKIRNIALNLPGQKDIHKRKELPALVRIVVWLGQERYEPMWQVMLQQGHLAVFAETYENQVNIPGLNRWVDNVPTRPSWSDINGHVELEKSKFKAPAGWRWDGTWEVSVDISLFADPDEGHRTFTDEVYENQTRMPGASWGPAKVNFTNVTGDPQESPEEFYKPEGWEWEDEWAVDMYRAVDEDGWEYALEATMASFGATERSYHLCRRRRLVRSRNRVETEKFKKEREKQLVSQHEGWEFAVHFKEKFHMVERTVDLVRRRRWQRRMVCDLVGQEAVFTIKQKKSLMKKMRKDSPAPVALIAPRMFLVYEKQYKYHLRAYIYQARDLLSADSSGFSDPYARVSFLHQSGSTEVLNETLSPMWDQTLIFGEITIFGSPEEVLKKPPDVIIEFYDYDLLGSPEFLGRAKAAPFVKLDPSDNAVPRLQWYPIYVNSKPGGELLASFELFLTSETAELPPVPPRKGELYIVPPGIRPVLQRTAVEILAWGVRNMKRYQLMNVTTPSVEFDVAGDSAITDIIKNTKVNPNFEDPVLFLDIMLPVEELYAPPMNLRVRDHREFGRKPLVGAHSIMTLHQFVVPPPSDGSEPKYLDVKMPYKSLEGTLEDDEDSEEEEVEEAVEGTEGEAGTATKKSRESLTSGAGSSRAAGTVEGSVKGARSEASVVVIESDMDGASHHESAILIMQDADDTRIDMPAEDRKVATPTTALTDTSSIPSYGGVGKVNEGLEIEEIPFGEAKPGPVAPRAEPGVEIGEEATGSDKKEGGSTKGGEEDEEEDEVVGKKGKWRRMLKKKLPGKLGKKMDKKKKKEKAGDFKLFQIFSEGRDKITGKKKKKKGSTLGNKFATPLMAQMDDIDWWSKFYASIGEADKSRNYIEKGFDTIDVYSKELEKTEGFDGFNDFCHIFELKRGKAIEEEDGEFVGQIKATLKVYKLPDDEKMGTATPVMFNNLPSNEPVECLVRVYVIRGIDFQPCDAGGLADPYIVIKCGDTKQSSRKEYIPNNLNPVFGKMFELTVTLPLEKDLKIRALDMDLIGSDDMIGETIIDLENRYLTSHRALAGLPQKYWTEGVCKWRDQQKPTDILADYCEKNEFPQPIYDVGKKKCKIGPQIFRLRDFEGKVPFESDDLGEVDERLALHILRGLPLVPEHVETRPLYNPLQPGLEQGRLQLWVDIFPAALGEPPIPVDIRPRNANKFEIRVIIWNTTDVILEEENLLGEKMSDIYVKGWISGIDKKQETDVHYRSLDGEGNFNWRFVFPFEYLPAEGTMVVKKKEHFWSLDETERKLPPLLELQIWDNDLFSADDYLGQMQVNLMKIPKPAKNSKQCNLKVLPDPAEPNRKIKYINLFEARKVRGFWPCYNDETGERELTGKIEMEMELITGDDAEERPSGQGQEEPNQNPTLDPPKRPATSFLWFTSPWKTLKFIIWKRYKWYIITGFIISLLIALVVLFFYSMPGYTVQKVFGFS